MLHVGDHKPQAYIDGKIWFHDLEFKVNPNVLIPRIETEKLVDIVLEEIESNLTNNSKNINIIETGTGSGCISISIAKALENIKYKEILNTSITINLYAIDISDKALEVAKENALLNRVGERINFFQNNLLENITEHIKKEELQNNINIIVANLPYIPTAHIDKLDSSVKDYEPMLALDGGIDGFDIYRKLFQQIKDLNTNNINTNVIAIEIDDEQDEIALKEGTSYFGNQYNSIKLENDIFKYPRFLIIKK